MLKRGSFDENVNDLSISANKKTYHKDMIVVGMKAQYDIAHDKGRATHLMAEASVGKNLSSRNLDFKAFMMDIGQKKWNSKEQKCRIILYGLELESNMILQINFLCIQIMI
ncbi:Uncharacterised protein [Fusobacterium necrophorum subsp. necrophorum]|nr:Uncharacterised protein [Fusobacterium necrophorum subsp. necrophorum]